MSLAVLPHQSFSRHVYLDGFCTAQHVAACAPFSPRAASRSFISVLLWTLAALYILLATHWNAWARTKMQRQEKGRRGCVTTSPCERPQSTIEQRNSEEVYLLGKKTTVTADLFLLHSASSVHTIIYKTVYISHCNPFFFPLHLINLPLDWDHLTALMFHIMGDVFTPLTCYLLCFSSPAVRLKCNSGTRSCCAASAWLEMSPLGRASS